MREAIFELMYNGIGIKNTSIENEVWRNKKKTRNPRCLELGIIRRRKTNIFHSFYPRQCYSKRL